MKEAGIQSRRHIIRHVTTFVEVAGGRPPRMICASLPGWRDEDSRQRPLISAVWSHGLLLSVPRSFTCISSERAGTDSAKVSAVP